ncbi:MAG: VTC domain-containing protein [Candidatus Marinimicrobia bacterium]|nr:VTC domain-containing protein [Candidatus Neomarinimicrobiota bacterium]
MLNEIFFLAKGKNKRYERKFFVSDLSLPEIKSLVRVHPACFRQDYPQRRISSIYLDSFGLDSYFDNLAGIGNRIKTRIRWYGDGFEKVNNPVLEIKIKENLLGSKLRYPLEDFSLNKNLSKVLQFAIKTSNIPKNLKLYLSGLRNSSINSYMREYYISADKKFRLTIDYDLCFYNSNKKMIDRDVSNIILELKHDMENDNEARFVSSQFPFRVTKNSKYVVGVEKSFLFLESC